MEERRNPSKDMNYIFTLLNSITVEELAQAKKALESVPINENLNAGISAALPPRIRNLYEHLTSLDTGIRESIKDDLRAKGKKNPEVTAQDVSDKIQGLLGENPNISQEARTNMTLINDMLSRFSLPPNDASPAVIGATESVGRVLSYSDRFGEAFENVLLKDVKAQEQQALAPVLEAKQRIEEGSTKLRDEMRAIARNYREVDPKDPLSLTDENKAIGEQVKAAREKMQAYNKEHEGELKGLSQQESEIKDRFAADKKVLKSSGIQAIEEKKRLVEIQVDQVKPGIAPDGDNKKKKFSLLNLFTKSGDTPKDGVKSPPGQGKSDPITAKEKNAVTKSSSASIIASTGGSADAKAAIARLKEEARAAQLQQIQEEKAKIEAAKKQDGPTQNSNITQDPNAKKDDSAPPSPRGNAGN